ncbi:hypothetical protein OIU84_016188 [Salix udensis]|uniref:Uncharacterized protein n=1 Tax=Salix udensis TaxID=889485 RepID=A0AAD6J8V3_9ROSI|nr:hypothetical protein OIU84_016188 [Salix udensis]
MIYRKWSLLTGPMAILGGIMGTAVAVRVLFFENPYLKPEQKKQDSTPLTK